MIEASNDISSATIANIPAQTNTGKAIRGEGTPFLFLRSRPHKSRLCYAMSERFARIAQMVPTLRQATVARIAATDRCQDILLLSCHWESFDSLDSAPWTDTSTVDDERGASVRFSVSSCCRRTWPRCLALIEGRLHHVVAFFVRLRADRGAASGTCILTNGQSVLTVLFSTSRVMPKWD